MPAAPPLANAQEAAESGAVIGEAALVGVGEEANPRLISAITTERSVICTLDFVAFQRVLDSTPEMKRAVDTALAAWRAAVKPQTLASHWLLAPLAAAGARAAAERARLPPTSASTSFRAAASFSRGLEPDGAAKSPGSSGALLQGVGNIAKTAVAGAASAAAGAASAAAGATSQLLSIGDGAARKKLAAGGAERRVPPLQQLVACCTTRIVSEGSPVFGPDDPVGAAIVVSGTLVEKTATVRRVRQDCSVPGLSSHVCPHLTSFAPCIRPRCRA